MSTVVRLSAIAVFTLGGQRSQVWACFSRETYKLIAGMWTTAVVVVVVVVVANSLEHSQTGMIIDQ